MSKHDEMMAELAKHVMADIPGFEIRAKQTSWLMRLIGVVLWPINREFMTAYVTTLYPRIYVPAGPERLSWTTLAHEWVHLRRAKKHGPVIYALLYLFPASLALLALLSVFALSGNLNWLFNLLWLLALAPIPAYFRMRDEWEAYTVTLAIEYWQHGSVHNNTVDRIATHFTGSHYYFMWPFSGYVRRKLYQEVANIKNGVYDKAPVFRQVKELIVRVWVPATSNA